MFRGCPVNCPLQGPQRTRPYHYKTTTTTKQRTLKYFLLRCSVVAGEHGTGSPHKCIDQIRKNCQKKSENCVIQPLQAIFGHSADIFRTFRRHSLVWAVRRFARYNRSVFLPRATRHNESEFVLQSACAKQRKIEECSASLCIRM